MANINIRGLTEIDDPAYRYKMPKVMGKIEGRGNGIKTRIVNVIELAASLHRDPGEVTKFFGCELGSQTKWVEEEEKALVNGAHSDVTLQQLVFRYIQKFVLCPECKLPETDYKIKSEAIFHKCAACGAKELVDMDHKLTTFILGNVKKAKLAKKAQQDKEEKKKKKNKKEDEVTPEVDSHDKKDKKEDKKEKKHDKDKKDKKKKKKERPSEDGTDGCGSGNGENDDGSGDDAVSRPVNVDSDDAGAFDTAIESLARFLNNTDDIPLILEELRVVQTFSGFPAYYRVILLVCSCFTEGPINEEIVSSKMPLLKAVHADNPLLKRHMIGALELLVAMRRPELKPLLPVVLKFFYECDILEEEVILEWFDDETRTEFSPEKLTDETLAELKASCQLLVTWLEEAEEDTEDES